MAGGSGERFWPLSTKERPKQLLPLITDNSMIRETVNRLLDFISYEDIFIGTNQIQYNNLINELPEIPLDNVIVEPAFRDTAAAILYGSAYINSRCSKSTTIIVLASDHIVQKNNEFLIALDLASKIATKEKKIVTLGIKPTYPEVGFGYIKVQDSTELFPNYNISFHEKPSLEKAKHYIDSGNYLWNSGIFIFEYKTLIQNFLTYSPNHLLILDKLSSDLSNNNGMALSQKIQNDFILFPKISIDFAIMEKSKEIVCLPVDIGWSDVGSFDSMKESIDKSNFSNKNIVKGFSESEFLNSSNNLLISNDLTLNVYLIDITDVIIVKNKNDLLILRSGSSHKIKELLKIINEKSN